MSAPAHSPELSEPQTPMWLPALGALLFAGAFVYWAAVPSAPVATADAAASASAAGAAPPAPASAPSPAPSPMAIRPKSPGMPAPQGSAGGRHSALDPAKAAEVQRLLNRMPKGAQH